MVNSINKIYNLSYLRKSVTDTTIINLEINKADKEKVTVLECLTLYHNLVKYLGPLKDSMVYLLAFENTLKGPFIKLLMKEKYLEVDTKDPVTLSNAINICIDEIENAIVDGTVCLNDMCLNIKSSEDIKNLSNFVQKHLHHDQEQQLGLKGFRALQSIDRFASLVTCLLKVFEKFNLTTCISSKLFKSLLGFCEQLEDPLSVRLNDAVRMENVFNKVFQHPMEWYETLRKLFDELEKAQRFLNFCKVREFYGEQGKRQFHARYTFILQELCDLSEQHTVDALWRAYDTIAIFIDENIDFQKFMDGIHHLNVKRELGHIKALQHQSVAVLEEFFNRDEVL